MGQKVAIFEQTLQMFDGIPTDNCKISDSGDYDAQNFNFATKFSFGIFV